jgi:uncharacterized protein
MRTARVVTADGGVVCEKCAVATSPLTRMRGLLGRSSLASDEGILLRPASSVHTAFMRFPIDVVFVDRELVVLKIVPDLAPWKAAACRGAKATFELRAGEAARRGVAVGARLELADS